MMIAVSNTGIGFLSGSVGADEDTLSLTRMLYIPYTPALHPHKAFVYPSRETFRCQFQIIPSDFFLSPAMMQSSISVLAGMLASSDCGGFMLIDDLPCTGLTRTLVKSLVPLHVAEADR